MKSGDLTAVAPQTALEWRQKIELQGIAKRIRIQLVDEQGRDRGPLGEVEIQSGAGGSSQ